MDPDKTSAALSGLVNLLIGVAVWSLLAGVAGRTIVRRRSDALRR
ncbi:hypothetical protein NKG05_22825 [Oerskovia sp. M15]